MKVATIEPRRATNDQELAALVQHLTEQSKARRDAVVPVKDIAAVVEEDVVKFSVNIGKDMPPMLLEPTYRAHETIWERLDIQKAYYNRMGDMAPDLLATNINYWAERDSRNFLVRILGDKVRAFLSDRFRTLDSVELFFTCFDEVKNVGAKIVQADLTENKFYMKMLHPEWATKLDGFRMNMSARRQSRDDNNGPKYSILDHLNDDDDGGTWLVPGIVVQNSDVGQGSLHAELFIFDLVCSNGMIGNRTIHQVHLGAQMDLGYVSYETRELEDRAIWSKVRDLIRASFDQEQFLAYVKKIKSATEIQLEDPIEAVNLVVKNNSLDESAQQAILNELMSAGNNSVYGLLSAVTAVGRDKSNYDEGVKFERIGGDILEDPNEFVRVRRSARTTRQIAKESR